MNIPENVRGYVYRILTYSSPIAVYYGLASNQEAGLWLALAAAILGLGNGLASMNTSLKRVVAVDLEPAKKAVLQTKAKAVVETVAEPKPSRPVREQRPVQRPKKF
jgi:hypothetical protein